MPDPFLVRGVGGVGSATAVVAMAKATWVVDCYPVGLR